MRGLSSSLRRRWDAVYHRASIQMILSLSFTAVAVVGMVFLGLSLFLRFSASNNALLAENSQRVLSQVNLNLDARLREMMRVSDTAYYQIIKDADLAEEDLTRDLELLYYTSRESLVSIAVFADSGDLIAAVPLTALKNSVSPERESWFAAAQERIENLHFSTPHVQNLFVDPDYRYRWVVSLSRHVELTKDGAIESGVLLVDMSYGGIEQICKDVDLGSGRGYLYIVDGAGEIVYHPRQQLIYAGLLEENNRAAAAYADGSHDETFQGFLLVFVNLRLSAWITAPMKKLDLAVKKLEAGQETVDLAVNGPYEVEHLSRSIQSMVSTMRHLMDDIIQQEEQKRRSELDVLQSQINPHFLYNTLDSVIWMTENGRTEDAVVMLTSLARLFRISLSRGSNIITIADELEHARHYLTIQKMRYKNKFSADISAADGAEELYTIKLIVQPILENAIYHGMDYADGDGKIRISAFREREDVVIEVADNGPGMPAEVVERLLDQGGSYMAADSKGSGIGLRNVHRRIQLTFGREYGLTILSEPDDGTVVRIRLPALDGERGRSCRKEEPVEPAPETSGDPQAGTEKGGGQ